MAEAVRVGFIQSRDAPQLREARMPILHRGATIPEIYDFLKSFQFTMEGRDQEDARGFLMHKWIDRDVFEDWGLFDNQEVLSASLILEKLRGKLRSVDGRRYWGRVWEDLASRPERVFHSAAHFSEHVRKLSLHANKADEFSAVRPTEAALGRIIEDSCPAPWLAIESFAQLLYSGDTKGLCEYLGEQSERLDRVLLSGAGQVSEARPTVQHAHSSSASSSAGAQALAVNVRVLDEDTGRHRRAQRGDWYRAHDHGEWRGRGDNARFDRSRSPWRGRSTEPDRDRDRGGDWHRDGRGRSAEVWRGRARSTEPWRRDGRVQEPWRREGRGRNIDQERRERARSVDWQPGRGRSAEAGRRDQGDGDRARSAEREQRRDGPAQVRERSRSRGRHDQNTSALRRPGTPAATASERAVVCQHCYRTGHMTETCWARVVCTVCQQLGYCAHRLEIIERHRAQQQSAQRGGSSSRADFEQQAL